MKKKYSTLSESGIIDRYFLANPEKLELVENGAEIQLEGNVIIIKNTDSENRIDLIEEVYTVGIKVFETGKLFNQWMNTSSQSLENNKPVDILESPEGIERVLEELNNIERGLFL